MPGTSWPERLARAFAVLRGAVVILFSLALVMAPERTMPGSSTEPAHTLALTFASRNIVLGMAFFALAIGRRREALGWLLLADAALQVFDSAMAVVMGKGALVALPIAIGILDVWAGRILVRAGRPSPASHSG
jgi:hypothetical protein